GRGTEKSSTALPTGGPQEIGPPRTANPHCFPQAVEGNCDFALTAAESGSKFAMDGIAGTAWSSFARGRRAAQVRPEVPPDSRPFGPPEPLHSGCRAAGRFVGAPAAPPGTPHARCGRPPSTGSWQGLGTFQNGYAGTSPVLVNHCVSVKLAMFASPPIRVPLPDQPTPPNGITGSSATVWSLMCTIPAGMRSARSTARITSRVMIPSDRP